MNGIWGKYAKLHETLWEMQQFEKLCRLSHLIVQIRPIVNSIHMLLYLVMKNIIGIRQWSHTKKNIVPRT